MGQILYENQITYSEQNIAVCIHSVGTTIQILQYNFALFASVIALDASLQLNATLFIQTL